VISCNILLVCGTPTIQGSVYTQVVNPVGCCVICVATLRKMCIVGAEGRVPHHVSPTDINAKQALFTRSIMAG
jgi:hypothetical protein